MSKIFNSTINILLVEDNPGDIELANIAFKQSRYKNKIHVVTDGEKALRFLHKKSPYQNKPTPDLILLDLNLPRLDGKEVLEKVKQNEILRKIPVIIFSTSKKEEDIITCYDLHATCFISKPHKFVDFVDTVEKIEEFWTETARLPA